MKFIFGFIELKLLKKTNLHNITTSIISIDGLGLGSAYKRVATDRADLAVFGWVALCKYTRRKLNGRRTRCSCNMKFKTLKGISITRQSRGSSYRFVSRRTKKGQAMRGLSKYERFLCHDRRRQKIEGCGVQKWRKAMIPTVPVCVCTFVQVYVHMNVCVHVFAIHAHTRSSATLPLTTCAAQSRRLYSWCCKLKIFDFYATIRQRNEDLEGWGSGLRCRDMLPDMPSCQDMPSGFGKFAVAFFSALTATRTWHVK